MNRRILLNPSKLVRELEKAEFERRFEELNRLLGDLLNNCILLEHEVDKGMPIQRIRNNYNGELFNEVYQISIRKDAEKINSFGRCNLPHQPVF